MSTKLSLCMIVKATDDESKLLDRCLRYVASSVDEICITITGKNKACERVAKSYGAKISYFDWVNDFSRARNFNFSQATGDYILWLDCDDILRGAVKLKGLVDKMEAEHIDAVVMNYLYDFDKNGRCTVKHLKTRVVKNDGCVKWVGDIHEDFEETRQLNPMMCHEIEVIHKTDGKRARGSAERNLEIAKKHLDEKPGDPRSLWLMANAHMGLGNAKEAEQFYKDFVEVSGSEEEIYLALLNLADLNKLDGEKAKDYALKALWLRPSYPNAYIKLGEYAKNMKRLDEARSFLEIGVQLPRPDTSIIVFNPMEYDYIPLVMLTDIAFEKGEYQKAMKSLESLLEIFPGDEGLEMKKKVLDNTLGELKEIDKYLAKARALESDLDALKVYLDELPEKIKQHPKMCLFRNLHFIKTESSGKDLVYYCSYTTKEWSPKTTAVGGSEEAVINLSRELSKLGWNVTVYNNCGKDAGVYDGVTYKPFWDYNVRDKQDVTIYWRHPRFVDYHTNGGKVIVDMHDVVPPGEFNKSRLEKIDTIFVKSQAHRVLFPDVPDGKFRIVTNGIELSQFKEKVKKNPYLVLNTSSPDRHLEATLDVFEELIKREPEKPWKLEWWYGWGVYDDVHEHNKEMKDWKTRQMARFDHLKALGRAEGGKMLQHTEIAKKYLEAGIFLYPTQFYEIDCISARKAQIAGCKVVSSDFAALKETVQFGYKVHTEGERWGKENTFGDMNTSVYVDAILSKDDLFDSQEIEDWSKQFAWSEIAKKWNKVCKSR